MDERDYKAMNEELNQPSCLGDVIGSIYTYIIVCDKTFDNRYKVKIGITQGWENRYRIYKLHNQNIKDIIVFKGNYEYELLFKYREYRICDEATERETEWIDIDYNPIEEVKKEFNITNTYFEQTKKYAEKYCL